MMYLVLIGIIIYLIIFKNKPKNVRTSHEPIVLEDISIEDLLLKDYSIEESNITFEFSGKYQKRYLLSKNEYNEFKKLKELANKRNLMICPKVRLLDLVEPRKGEAKYKTLFYKIQAKHVDFVICDQNLYVKAILELDDNSHNQADRKARDEFVDTVLKDVGYKVIRTHYITETTLDII